MIIGWVGPPGTGKTYSMTRKYFTWYRQQKHIPLCYTNMDGLRVPGARYMHDVEELTRISNCHVLADEAGAFLSSRYWQSLPRSVMVELAQVRKDGIELWYTTQHENRVDTIVRENTGRLYRCYQFGPYFVNGVENPNTKTIGNRDWVRRDPRYYFLYNTFGKIGATGGSSGEGSGAFRELRPRKRYAEEAKRAKQKQPKPTLIYTHYDDRAFMRKRTRDAIAYLAKNDRLRSGADWVADVRQELDRRAWLRKFRLDPDDMPIDCTYENPWEDGYSPAQVVRRHEENELKTALALIAAYGNKERLSEAKTVLLNDALETRKRLEHILPEEVGF